MSQLERQYDELEIVGREIEEALRDAEDSKYSNRGKKVVVNVCVCFCSISRGTVHAIVATAGQREERARQEDS